MAALPQGLLGIRCSKYKANTYPTTALTCLLFWVTRLFLAAAAKRCCFIHALMRAKSCSEGCRPVV